MKNYTDSDYALNKHSKGIVYRFCTHIAEITLEAYLAENPGRTEQDFLELKSLSDADYYDQDRTDYNQTRKNVSMHKIEDSHDLSGHSLDEQYIHAQDTENAAAAFARLLENGTLTETQKRRFLMYIQDGLSLRQIAVREGVALRAIQQSVYAASDKLKEYFNLL